MKLLFFSFLLTGALLMASCSDDETEKATLSLSELALAFPKDASEKSVTVTTNQPELSIVSNMEWVEVVQSGATLTVKVKANPNSTNRDGTILIVAGGVPGTITVTQSGAEINLAAIPDKLEIDQWGGERVFDLDINTDNWSVETDAEWITLAKSAHKKNFVMQITENKEKESRSAKITIKADSTATEFVVEQSGIMRLILPYLNFGANMSEVQRFEEARGSDCTECFDYRMDFLTQSSMFNIITYDFSNEKKKLAHAIMSFRDLSNTGKNTKQEIDALLKKIGFEPTSLENYYLKKGDTYGVEAAVEYDRFPKIVFSTREIQTEPHATFATFPPDGFFDWGTEKSAIMDWEKKNGGTFDADNSFEDPRNIEHSLTFLAEDSVPLRKYRTVFKGTTRGLKSLQRFYRNVNLCFWQSDLKTYLTKEFSELMEKEGFQYRGGQGTNANVHVFIHIEKKTYIYVDLQKITQHPEPALEIYAEILPSEYL